MKYDVCLVSQTETINRNKYYNLIVEFFDNDLFENLNEVEVLTHVTKNHVNKSISEIRKTLRAMGYKVRINKDHD